MSEQKAHKQRIATVAVLKAVVDGVEAEKAEVEARLSIAYSEYHQAEREQKRYEPLTPKQREVLELLVKNDATVTESDLYGRRYWVKMPPDRDGRNVRINRSVFFGLLSREAIGGRTYSGALRHTYTLTEHGRLLVMAGPARAWTKPKQRARCNHERANHESTKQPRLHG